MNINLALIGQSNARYLFTDGYAESIRARVAQELGFNGTDNTVSLINPADTTFPGTALLPGADTAPSWLNGSTGNFTNGDLENQVQAGLSGAPASAVTVIMMMHNESDSTNPNLTTAEWESGIRFEIAQMRATMGKDAAHSPVMFTFVPFSSSNGSPYDKSAQAIKNGMAQLIADTSFNAFMGPQTGDVNMDRDPIPTTTDFFGASHMDASDEAIVSSRMADSVGQELDSLAQPGSPLATSMGSADLIGPYGWHAQSVTGHPDMVLVHFQNSPGQSLTPGSSPGYGWSAHAGDASVSAVSATVMDAGDILITMSGDVPQGSRIYYGYGEGRISPSSSYNPATGVVNAPGEGQAVYDTAGMPAVLPPDGLQIDGTNAAVPGPADLGRQPGLVSMVVDGQGSVAVASAYQGGVGYLSSEYIYAGGGGVAMVGDTPNMFLTSGPGMDAIAVTSGNNVLDGGTGSNFLVGGTGQGTDTFFVDARPDATTWDTIMNFHPGDAVTMWGFDPSHSKVQWADTLMGAPGAQGATMFTDAHGHGLDTGVTFAGMSIEAAKNMISISGPGSGSGVPYLYIYNQG